MEVLDAIATGGLAVTTAAITAYVTTRLQGRNERRKWQRELASLQAERQAKDPEVAMMLAQHYGIGYVISSDRERFFLMPGTTLSVGRGGQCDIRVPDECVGASRLTCLLSTGDNAVALVDATSRNGIRLNGNWVQSGSTQKLRDGDVIAIGQSPSDWLLEFHTVKRRDSRRSA
jgi:hypothetical protein